MPDDSTSSWAEVAQELGTGRTGKSAMNQATAKGFRTAQLHRVAHNWGKDHKVWGADKNKKRAEKRKADQAAAAVASPAVSPPASSAKRQRPVAGAMAEVVITSLRRIRTRRSTRTPGRKRSMRTFAGVARSA